MDLMKKIFRKEETSSVTQEGKRLTIEQIREMHALAKGDFYAYITGYEPTYSLGVGVTHGWMDNVRKDNMDEVLEAVEKMEQMYPEVPYYLNCINPIKEAYRKRDFQDFQDCVGGLLASINMD